jgi:hypothetical protein
MPKAPYFYAAGSLANILFAFNMPSSLNTGLLNQTFLAQGNHNKEGCRSATLCGSKPEKSPNNRKGFISCVNDQVTLDLVIDVAGITPLTRASAAGRKASKS